MSLSEKIKPRVQIINISMIDVYLVWFISIYITFISPKSRCLKTNYKQFHILKVDLMWFIVLLK